MLKTGAIFATALLALCMGTSGASAQSYYYGDDCHSQNAAAGTVLGAIAGGVIGNQFGRGGGRVAATAGGVILGGMAGNAIAGDIDCDDRPYAFKVYDRGFYGPIGERYEWRHHGRYGYFMPTREYVDDHGYTCRDFEEGVWRDDTWRIHMGTACLYDDGWRFL